MGAWTGERVSTGESRQKGKGQRAERHGEQRGRSFKETARRTGGLLVTKEGPDLCWPMPGGPPSIVCMQKSGQGSPGSAQTQQGKTAGCHRGNAHSVSTQCLLLKKNLLPSCTHTCTCNSTHRDSGALIQAAR